MACKLVMLVFLIVWKIYNVMMLKYRCQCWYSDVTFDAKIDPHFVANNYVVAIEFKCVQARYLQKNSPNTGLDQILMLITIFEVKDVDVMTMSCRPRSDLQDIFSTMFSRRLHGGLDW